MRLLPQKRDHGWAPYVWLVFLSFFFFQPILDKHTTGKDWVITIAGTVVFLIIYFSLFRVAKPWNYVLLACMASMGLGLGKVNVGSSVFIIFTAVFLPWILGSVRAVFLAIGILILLLAGDA